jgi:hypothetical protein
MHGRDNKLNLRDTGVDGRTLLKYKLKKQDVGMWIGFNWLRTG